jgi:chromosome segregation ATPase
MSEDLTGTLPRSDSDKLTLILKTVQAFEDRIHDLEQQAEERRYDTRPIWEKLVADIAQLQESIRTETREIKVSLRTLSRGQSVLNDTILKVHVDLRDIDERLQALEDSYNQQNSST